MSLHSEILAYGERALAASRLLSQLTEERKNSILSACGDALDQARPQILEANEKDLVRAREDGLSASLLDRLTLTDGRIDGMIEAFRVLAKVNDPVGEILSEWNRPSGIVIEKRRVPIGVIGIIYESRPNVTADAAGLCLKASNAVILRGGKEAFESNRAIISALREGGDEAGLPEGALQLIETTDREAVRELCQLEGYVHLIIPRGGEGLIRAVSEMARVPVIKHYKGVCHVYVDRDAESEMALRICANAKCSRPGVCNAAETVLVHQAIAAEFLPRLCRSLSAHGVEIRGDAAVQELVPGVIPAVEQDWSEEYLGLILSVKVVGSIEEAISHIGTYGSEHSDAIVTDSQDAAEQFVKGVDSANVLVNVSTRFVDGGEYGMGAEIGISTDRLHARGPMGVSDLTTYKYVVRGTGQIRE